MKKLPLSIGTVINHAKFGIGTIVNTEGSGDSMRTQIKFHEDKTRWLIASYANLTIMSNGAPDENFDSDESDNQKAFDEQNGTSDEVDPAILELKRETENLKNSLKFEQEIRWRNEAEKDRKKSEIKTWLVLAAFMVLLAMAYIAQDEWLCNGYDCIAV